jgi:exopolysaccharide biosynthesis polyprenyl glycosylphosphotransferase
MSHVGWQGEALLPRPAGGYHDAARPTVAEGYGRRDFLVRRMLLASDMVGLLLALVIASQASSRAEEAEFLLVGLLSLPVWIVLFQVYGLYHRGTRRVSHTPIDDLPSVFHAVLVACLLTWVIYKVALPSDQLVLVEIAVLAAVSTGGVLLSRLVVRRIVARHLGLERTLLIGTDEAIGPILRKIRTHPEYGLEPVGRLAIAQGNGSGLGLPVLGSLERFEEVAAEHGVERLIVSHTGLAESTLLDLLRLAKPLGLKVSVLPQMFDVMGPSVEIDDVEGVTIVGIHPPVLSRSSRALKRTMDIAGASLLLLLTAPLLVAIAIANKLDSRGPVLYRQRRVGKSGKHFDLLKFRTMTVDAEARVEELMAHSKDEYWLHLEDDPRITAVGKVLRYTSLDELPQFVNVLKGDMSLVGPRPLVEAEDSRIGGWGRCRLDLMPGITGSWQVLGRTNIPFDEMVKLDYLYVTNWSLWRDVRLMLRTLPAVLTRRGAN